MRAGTATNSATLYQRDSPAGRGRSGAKRGIGKRVVNILKNPDVSTQSSTLDANPPHPNVISN